MEKYKRIKLASIFGIVGNMFLLVIKFIVAILFKSSAMIADTFNSAGDIFSSIMTYIGNSISEKPIDEDHDLGHGKAEYIFSLIISVIMIFSGCLLIKDSIIKLIKHENMTFSIWLIIVCLVTIIVKLLLFIYTNHLSKKYNNILIKANSMDHLNDIFVTLANVIAIIFAKYSYYFVDGAIGIIISLWIIYSYIKILIESYDVLMDKTISIDKKNEVLEIINNNPNIKKYNHFNATPIGYEYQISISIFVDGNLSTFESHEIADKLEKEIVKKVDGIYLAIIHVNPYQDTKKNK